jgi:phosphatidylserine/phosphatidylglycerophosphate/cardiolipin synthase-like enzyme
MHSKTITTTTAGMMGSYNYTYGSRYLHSEDGLLFEDTEMLEMYRIFFKPVWDKAAFVKPQNQRIRTRNDRQKNLKLSLGWINFLY